MKRKLSLLALTAGLTLGIAAPSQAATASPSLLDFGTFSIASPPKLLSSTITGGGTHPYFAGLEMISGQPYFFPSSNCPEAKKDFAPCPVNVSVVIPITATGPLTGVVGVKFTDDGGGTETLPIEVRANVTAPVVIPPVTTPPALTPPTITLPGSGDGGSKPKKKPCKKAGAKSSVAKKHGKGCSGANKKGKAKAKGKGKSKGR
jgi:hypothetical protein